MGTDNRNPRAFLVTGGEVLMRQLRAGCLQFVALFRKEQQDRELAEELESHLQMHVEDNLRSGLNPAEARRQALIKLGGVEQARGAIPESNAGSPRSNAYGRTSVSPCACSARALASRLSPF